MRQEVRFMQKKQNDKWDYPVFMLYYNKEESFENFNDLVKDIELTKR